MSALLEEVGYYVVQEEATATDPGTWGSYDFLVWSDGNDSQPLSNEPNRTALENYITAGGKLLIEGGEVGYDALSYPGYPTFAANVLHASSWGGDDSGNLGIVSGMESHPVASTPNTLPSAIGITYSDYGDQDACSPASEAYAVYDCASDPGDAGVLVYDDTPSPESAQVVFYCFNWAALSDSTARAQLLENTAVYLLAQETPPTGGISGAVDLKGTNDESGVVVTASSGAKFTRSDTTGTDGSYLIDNLYNATYMVTAHKLGYVDSSASDVVVAGGGVTTGVDFNLYPQQVIFFMDFEGSGYLSPTGDWEWGEPTSGPGSAYSGSKAWATVLNGNYTNSSNSQLNTDGIDLTGYTQATLTFWSWYSFEGSSTLYDGGNLKISLDAGPYSVITPVDGYDGTISTSNAAIPGEQGFATTTAGSFWHQETFDLTPHVGHKVFLRFHAGSDGSVAYPGWYIDDIMVIAPADVPGSAQSLVAQLMEEDVHLSWSPPADAGSVDHYVIYRGTSHDFVPGHSDSIGVTGDTAFVDTDAAVGQTAVNHYYVVEAVSGSGYRSEPSNCVGEFDHQLQVTP